MEHHNLYSGNRSPEAKVKRAKKREEYKTASNIVMDYSLHDQYNGEIIFSVAPYANHVEWGDVIIENATFQDIIHLKIREALGYVPACATNHDYGEILNRKHELLLTITSAGKYKHEVGDEVGGFQK